MLSRTINAFFWLIGVLVFSYVYFFVPVGRRTLFDHTRRIAATDEARELGDELEDASERVRGHLEERLAADAGVPDAR